MNSKGLLNLAINSIFNSPFVLLFYYSRVEHRCKNKPYFNISPSSAVNEYYYERRSKYQIIVSSSINSNQLLIVLWNLLVRFSFTVESPDFDFMVASLDTIANDLDPRALMYLLLPLLFMILCQPSSSR